MVADGTAARGRLSQAKAAAVPATVTPAAPADRTWTITFGEVAENHVGMQQVGGGDGAGRRAGSLVSNWRRRQPLRPPMGL